MKPYTRKDYRDQLLKAIQEAPLSAYLTSFSEEERFRLNELHQMTASQLEWVIEKAPSLLKKEAIQSFDPSLNDLDALKAWAFDLEPYGFDGVDEKAFYQALEHGATLDEIRALGKRYQLDIPRRIKKDELVDIIIKRGTHAPPKLELMKKNTLALEQYAKEQALHVSIELKKTDMIAYLADHLKQYQTRIKHPATLPKKPVKKAAIELPDAHLTEIISRHRFPTKAFVQILISILILALLIGGTLWLMA